MLDLEILTCHCRRVMMKNLFNPQFGSIFRTCHNPTYFSRRLCRFSDIYMSSVSCFLNYDLTYTFYPRRTPLQHEAPLWMDQLCTGCLKIPHLEEMSHIRWQLCPPPTSDLVGLPFRYGAHLRITAFGFWRFTYSQTRTTVLLTQRFLIFPLTSLARQETVFFIQRSFSLTCRLLLSPI